jgi:hypothetical protein
VRYLGFHRLLLTTYRKKRTAAATAIVGVEDVTAEALVTTHSNSINSNRLMARYMVVPPHQALRLKETLPPTPMPHMAAIRTISPCGIRPWRRNSKEGPPGSLRQDLLKCCKVVRCDVYAHSAEPSPIDACLLA